MTAITDIPLERGKTVRARVLDVSAPCRIGGCDFHMLTMEWHDDVAGGPQTIQGLVPSGELPAGLAPNSMLCARLGERQLLGGSKYITCFQGVRILTTDYPAGVPFEGVLAWYFGRRIIRNEDVTLYGIDLEERRTLFTAIPAIKFPSHLKFGTTVQAKIAGLIPYSLVHGLAETPLIMDVAARIPCGPHGIPYTCKADKGAKAGLFPA